MATKNEQLHVAGVKMSKMSQMLFLIFSLIHIVTYGAEVSIFGPQTITASPSKVKSTFQVSAETTSQVAGSIFIKNGNGSDLLLQNCSGLKGQQKKSCAAANQSIEDSATDRPSDFSVKWNGVVVVDSKSLPRAKGFLLIGVQVRSLNELVIDRLGPNGSSITVTVNADLPNRNQSPTAVFSFTPEFPVGPQLISFNGILSFDQDGQIVDYAWDFGDGSNGSGAFTFHQYTQPGTFLVKLTVTDNQSGRNSMTQSIVINANQLPVPSFTAAASASKTFFFNASNSADTDGSIVSYQWDFGDQTQGVGQTISHLFPDFGTYIVKLTVIDNNGGVSSISYSVSVIDPTPLAVVITSPQSGATFTSPVIEVRFTSNKKLQSAKVNGYVAQISSDQLSGKFYTQIYNEGPFTITVEAVDVYGETTSAQVSAVLQSGSMPAWTYEECPVEQ